MKFAYPIVLTPAETGYSVYVPDLDINTEGDSLADAIRRHRPVGNYQAGYGRRNPRAV